MATPTAKGATKARPEYKLFEDEDPDIVQEARKFFKDPEAWLDLRLDGLMGATPRELIGTEKEIWVRDLLRRLKYGIPA